MHELAITQGVVDTITERTSGARVTLVRLDIGKLSGVVPDAVAFCFELVADGTPLHAARLEINEPPGRAHCRSARRGSISISSSSCAPAGAPTSRCSPDRSWRSARWRWLPVCDTCGCGEAEVRGTALGHGHQNEHEHGAPTRTVLIETRS